MSGKPTVISTFAGCGGSSVGYRMAGFDERLAVEWDTHAVEVFRANFPGVPVYHGDIAKLTVSECLSLAKVRVGELDLLDGSPPCQGFSVSGKREMDDQRNTLFREYCRLLDGLKPKMFVMENVTGMVRGHMLNVYREILRSLTACGYEVRAAVMQAKFFEVPQIRERVIIIGGRRDLGLVPTHPKPYAQPITVRQAIKHLEGKYPPHPNQKLRTVWGMTPPGKSLRKVSPDCQSMQVYRLNPNAPSNTLTKSNPHWHYAEPRILSVEEQAILQGFPPDFKWSGNFRQDSYRIGNSVPPPLARAVGEHVIKLLRSVP